MGSGSQGPESTAEFQIYKGPDCSQAWWCMSAVPAGEVEMGSGGTRSTSVP